MRGFRSARGILGHPFAKSILILLALGAAVFDSGCTGLVSGSGSGNPGTLTITNAAAANVTATSVGVAWQTNVPASSQVEYGTTTSYGSMTAVDSTMVVGHQLTVSNLKPGTSYHCRVHSTDAQNVSAMSGDLSCRTPVDTTPPTVSITSPVANATLSGTVTLTANATDDVAVASVQFKVDNANTGAAITATPYSYALNTTTLSDGNHILTAVATDTSGNAATSAGVPVKVNNTAPGPSITSLSPTSGLVGASVTISGGNFGATQGTSTVTFNGVAAVPSSWSASSIVAPVPAGATTGNVVVAVGGVASNGVAFTVTTSAPSIAGLNPASGVAGTPVTITGANFGATQGTSTVTFNGVAAVPTSWSASSIVAPVPAGATTGNVVVAVGGVASNGVAFTVTTPVPSIAGLNPASGVVGTPVTITGANFGASQGSSTVKFGATTAAVTSWSASTIVAPVPAGATTGNVVVTVGGAASNGVAFTVTTAAPSIAGLNPASGAAGTPVTITGANFGATQGTSTVTFNGVAAVPASWSASSIVAPVPAGATTGNVVVTVGGVASNGVAFTVTTAAPSIAGLNPASGAAGTPVTITGANFGASQGSSTVKFGATTAAVTSWSASSIVAPVPAGATTGNVVVTVGGVTSNGVSFTVTVPGPSITSLSPTTGLVGASVTISGANFGATQGTSTVKFNGVAAVPTSWSASSIVAPVPAGATTGNVVVTVGGVASNGVAFTVTTPAKITPTAGTPQSATVNTAFATPLQATVLDAGNNPVSGVTVTFAAPASGASGTFAGGVNTATTNANGVATAATFTADGTAGGPYTVTASVAGVATPANFSLTNVAASTVAWPLKASANRRYLVDQNNVPFLLMGDAAHSLISAISPADMVMYMTTRASQGFNAIQVFTPCDTYETTCPASMASFSGVVPFTSGSSMTNYDLSTPNPAYWSIVDNILSTAAAHNLVVFLNPLETGGLLPLLEANGTTKVFNYGVFLGNRYKNTPNLVWDFGNDFQDWNSNPTDNNLIAQLMAGIASVDSNHLMDIELDYQRSYSNQDTTLAPTLSFDAAYTYFETYDCVLAAYNSSPTLPVFLIETNYEDENDTGYYSGTTGTFLLREQEYWTLTSGATGQNYGSHYTNHFISGWQSNLNTPGALEIVHLTQLFGSLPWWNLVPDQTHQIVTSGYGTYNGSNGNLPAANYSTTAWVTDGSLAVVYDPAGSALTVNLAMFSGPVTAQWYDPSNGKYTSINGSPFANTGSHVFSTPGNNNDGQSDWVLVLE